MSRDTVTLQILLKGHNHAPRLSPRGKPLILNLLSNGVAMMLKIHFSFAFGKPYALRACSPLKIALIALA